MYALTLDKLTGLLAGWDPAFQCTFLCVLVVTGLATAVKFAAVVCRAFELAVGAVEALVTVPVGVFWGWKDGCNCDGDDDDDADDADAKA